MDACVTSWSITQWVQQLRELSINTLQTPEAGPTSISNSSASTIVQPTAFTVQSHGPAVSISASSISLPHQGQASGPVQHSHNRTQLRALSPAQAAATPLAPQGRDVAYVNPKQFGRILRRRETRRKLDQELGPLVRRPYQHRSRHIHASSRVRDTNGRFGGGARKTKEVDAKSEYNTNKDKNSTCGGVCRFQTEQELEMHM